MTAKRTTSVYSVHPGFKMDAAYHRNLVERTGKSIDEWVAFVKKSGPGDRKSREKWLITDHGLTRGYASWIAESVDGVSITTATYDPDALVEAMFAGGKAGLRPIYDALLKLGFSQGKDVTASPGKTIVPLYRNRLFARIIPSTRTRIDLALALLPTTKPTSRLKPIPARPGSKDRINFQIAITSLEEIDDEVKRWLKKAYDLDAE